ncbi:splicing factor, suppressor of white-apricot homolog [Bolinopsis microptera]|uniref:splicing factor, suppressor of white-apricot homolog n=1 Tax=Bolinopsis microptera TaxID=2820187 RepID=UPI003078B3F7
MSHSNYELGANGSAVTLFADPENAVSVNEGVTLIPWMGDSSNLIDRYDVRGHLYSESEFGLRKNDTDVDIEEAKLEEELDKERFMFLTVDELEFEAYLEEEEKRFNNKKKAGGPYLQVDFSYQGPSENVPQTVSKPTSISEEVYVPDKNLAVPDGMITPKTDKHYKVVEKTAAFLSTQNLQTEIVIRTKQKDNPIFHFLEPDHELNPFYKHVLSAIKRKIIVVQSEAKPKPVVPSAAEQQAALEAQQRAQLQAQQLQAQQQQEALIAQQQEYERQQQLAHQQLLARQKNELQQNSGHAQWNKIGGELLHSGEKKGVGSSLAALSAYGAASDSDNSSSEDEEEKNPSTLNSMINNIPVPPGTSPEVIQYLIMSGFVALPPPAPGLPQLLVPPAGYEGFSIPTAPPPPPPEEEVQITTEEPEECHDIERPASPNTEQKGIITKLAEYVVKNGDSFERKVQKKQDTRFAFVNPGNEHHNYYQYLIQKFRNKRVKLNVAPIKIRTKSSQLNPTANVDSTVFNQSSSEDEESKEESEELTQSSNLTTSSPQRAGQISRSPSRSPLPQSSSQTESHDTDSVFTSQETGPQSLSSPLQSPHPLDSDHESSPPPSSDTRLERQNSPSKTPVYTQETEDRTPSPIRTPQDDRTQTPEIKIYPCTPVRPEVDSEAESVDSETKGMPLVQHFSDDDSELDSRYDLDGKRSRSPSKSPAKSRSRSRSVQKEGEGSKSVTSPVNHTNSRSQKDSETKSQSPKKSRSRSVSLKRPRSRTKSRSPKRSRTRTRSYSRSRSQSRRHGSETPNSSAFKSDNEELFEKQRQEKEELRQREESLNQREELLRKKEELLKKKEEELPEEGEISDGSTKRKHKKHVSSRGRSRSKSPSKHKKKKKDRSRKREGKSSRSESRSSSRKKQKMEHKEDHKRKKPTPPRKSDTDEWMSEKMKKLSKIELLKEIEDKLEEKKKLREQKEESPKPKIASSEKSSKKDKRDKHHEKKDVESTSDKHSRETKSSTKNGSHFAKEADTKEGKKESKFDEEKRLAMEKELAQIEAKLQAKKLKKSKDVVDETKKKVNDKANGHSEKSKNKKHKKERSKEKKS